jgi:2-dehydropantoate 2-reductase
MSWKPVIAIVGAGAVGGYYGARLAQHGHAVHFLLRSEYESVRRSGMVVRSCSGNFTLPPDSLHIYNDVGRMPKVDLVIVTLKCTSNDQYEPLIRPLLDDRTMILTLQNGLGNEQRLAELFGAERVFGGLCNVCINRGDGGVIHHLANGLIRFGDFIQHTQPTERAAQLVGLLTECGIPSEVLPSLAKGRWEKLVWNIPFNGLGAVLNLTTDVIIGSPWGLAMVRRIMEEVIAAAAGSQVSLDPAVIDFNLNRTKGMGAYKSSMQIDRQLSRPMEIEAILGEPVRAAKRSAVDTPHMAMLYEMAKLVEMGSL